jgi:spore maturation protein CgeB
VRLLIVGGSGGTNVGDSLNRATVSLSLSSKFCDYKLAYESPALIQKINWYLRNKYPSRLQPFSQIVSQACREFQPNYLLTTGLAPLNYQALQDIGRLGIKRLNFLTDDPFNPAHQSAWFLKALTAYDVVFSPRRANLAELMQRGCRMVEYLPFGYDPDLFYAETDAQLKGDAPISDVIFAGGADRDRIPYINVLIQAGLHVNLYGSYWERYPQTRPYTKGQADVTTLRQAISTAKIGLCLVRHANRDGHCMRTFEVPAIGTCMLTEDTPEHRDIFGAEGAAVVYFSTLTEMVEKARWLLQHEAERQRLAQSAHHLITQGGHTYRDRLKTMLSL